jgi:hypothetical protein
MHIPLLLKVLKIDLVMILQVLGFRILGTRQEYAVAEQHGQDEKQAKHCTKQPFLHE